MTRLAAPARTDVYVRFTDEQAARTRRIGMTEQDVHLDVDAQGRPVGVEILAAAGVEINGADPELALAAAREAVRGWDEGEWRVGPRGTAAITALHHALAALDKTEEASRG